MLSVFSEFERAIIQERIAAGMARAKANGTKSGKPIGRPRIAARYHSAERCPRLGRAGFRLGKAVGSRRDSGAEGLCPRQVDEWLEDAARH